MAIGAIIGIISSVIQAVRAFSPPEAQQPQQKADKLFSELDAMGQGFIRPADLEKAFDRIAATAASGADKLFTKLDADGDGTITRNEFSGSISQLADHLDQHYMRLRLHGGNDAPPAAAAGAGFTREELTGLASSLAGSFDRADADGDGRVSLREARTFAQADSAGAAPSTPPAGADNRNVEMMLQVVRLMQAYGVVGKPDNDGDNTGTRIADQA